MCCQSHWIIWAEFFRIHSSWAKKERGMRTGAYACHPYVRNARKRIRTYCPRARGGQYARRGRLCEVERLLVCVCLSVCGPTLIKLNPIY